MFLEFYPLFRPTATKDCLTQLHLMVPILRRGEKHRRLPAAGNVFINGAVLHLMAVVEAFRMTPRRIRKMGYVFPEARRASLQHLVWFIPAAQVNLVRMQQVP